MNILVIGKFYAEGFALHIAETLVTMGHTVKRFEPGLQSNRMGEHFGFRVNQVRDFLFAATDGIPSVRAWRIGALWTIAKQSPLDVAIVCHDFLLPAEVAELRQCTGALVALWFPDSVAGLGRAYFM